MKMYLLFLSLFLFQFVSAQPTLDPSHHVPVDKQLPASWKKELWRNDRKIYKGEELTTIGMPCGGIAAGQLYVRGDGTLAGWWIANNAYNTGYGKDSLMNFPTALGPWKVCYQTFTPPSYIEQGFTVTVRQNGKTVKRSLDKNDFDDISFIGEYPLARIGYSSRQKLLPVAISLDVFSPFIPLDARESATPGTVLKYTLKNTSGGPLDIDLTGRVENLVGLDLKDSITGLHRNSVIKSDGMTGVYMDLDRPVFKRGGAVPANHPYLGNLSLNVLDGNGYADADFGGAAGRPTGRPMAAAAKGMGEKLVGAAGTTLHLNAGESREVTFLLTWYFPNRPSYYYGDDVTKVIPNDWNEALPTRGATILGNMYANWYNSSRDVALWLKGNLPRLSRETYRFHDTYYNNSTIPYWLLQRVMMPVSTLATETCEWWANDKFWAWEGVGSCVGTCTHVWNYEQALARLFPELERNIREKTDFGTSFQKDGSVLARNGWGDVLIDGHAGAILKAYREHLFSANELFLSRNWPRIKKALEFLIAEDGNEDGLIEKQQANTYDIAFYGANTYVGGLYLAALRAGAKMAEIMKDTAFAGRCDTLFQRGQDNTVKKLWNGSYFNQEVDLEKHPKYQYANGCLSDQLLGQTWSHLIDLGYIYPREKVQTALQSIWKYNWAPDVALQNKVHPPERVYADAGEAGLLVCTWPFGKHMGEDGVRYRDEVWTGIEYQVATNMIYENMIGEGLSLVFALHDRYNGTKHNPWNEIECGDHYARAMASWGVLMALEDFQYDGPGKKLGFHPKIRPDDFSAFFTAAEGWGSLGQKRSQGLQTNTVTVAFGRLQLANLEISSASTPRKVEVRAGDREIPCMFTFHEGRVMIQFDEVVLNEGQRLTVVISLK